MPPKFEPIMRSDDVQYAADRLASRIKQFAADLRRDLRAAVRMRETLAKAAMSPDAKLDDVQDAAIAIRAVAIASDRRLDDADLAMLKRLGSRITELDDGDVVAAVLALVAIEGR